MEKELLHKEEFRADKVTLKKKNHQIKYADSHKKLAFTMKWIA